MIDLHCHILPGVDDGAASITESCMMARLAVESGVTELAATPHYNIPGQQESGGAPFLKEQFLELAERFRRENIPLKLHTGMEVFVTPEVPRLIREKRLLTLGGSRYLLVEFDFDAPRRYADRMLEEIAGEGCIPVVAHPERYFFAQEDWDCLLRWAQQGYVLQVNKGSFFGMFGRRAQRTAHWCLGEGCIHLVGSDAHSPYRRTTRLHDAWAHVAEWDGPEIADFLLKENPGRILQDKPVRAVMAQF